jgi:hypothetical protein
MGASLKSSTAKALLTKIWAPMLILGLPAGLISAGTTLGRILAIPFIILVIFLASAAVVNCRNSKIRYRRFLKWKTLSSDEIVSVRTVWEPFLGSIRSTKFVAPWGRIYFILDDNFAANPFGKGDYPLVACIGSGSSAGTSEISQTSGRPHSR